MAKQKKAEGPKLNWSVTKLNRNVFRVNAALERKVDWHLEVLLASDHHWDHPQSDLKLQKKHLEEAKAKGAPIIFCGDFFCCMQGKYDKRANKDALRPEHRGDNYFDLLVESAAEFLKPYANNLVVIASGNHEQKILDMHEVNLVDRLCLCVRGAGGGTVYPGGYSGIVMFSFAQAGESNKKWRYCISLRYEHGAGGGGVVTGDMISHFRRIGAWPDIDIMISGHTHDSWMREFARKRVNRITGTITQDLQTHVKLPSYKNGFGDGFDSWEARQGMAPKPIGAYWLKFYYDHRSASVLYEIVPAK